MTPHPHSAYLSSPRSATSQEAFQNATLAAQARATAKTGPGEASITGNSISVLMQNFDRQEAMNRMSLQQKLGWKHEQARQGMVGQQAAAQSRISGVTPAPVRIPSMLAVGLEIGTSMASSYDQYQRMERKGVYS